MKKIIFILTLLVFTSCIKKVQNSGYSFEDVNIDDIKVGVTTKENLLKDFGSPSIKSCVKEDSEEVWIYYSDVKNGYFFFKPLVRNQKVLAITFNENDVVASREEHGIEQLSNNPKEIKIVRDSTRKKENKDNVFMDIVNNIGTVRSM